MKEKIIEMFESGMSCYAISKETPYSKETINKNLKSWGYDTSRDIKRQSGNSYIMDQKDEIIRLYTEEKFTMQQIVDKLNIKSGTGAVHRVLSKFGANTRDNTIYAVNERFMDEIDTHDKAYFLGLYYADGCTRPDKISISLKESDRPLLEYCKRIFDYTGVVGSRESRNSDGSKKGEDQALFYIARKYLVKRMSELGCPPNKVHTCTFPTQEQLPREFLRTFIAGYMMGDGSITYNAREKLTCCFCGNREFIGGLKEQLPESVEATNTYDMAKTSANLCFGRQKDIMGLLDWMYEGLEEVCGFLEFDRKYKIYKEYKASPKISRYDRAEALKPEIIRLYNEEGMKAYSIGKKIGVSKSFAAKVIKENCDFQSEKNNTRQRILDHKDMIIERYLANEFVKDIAKDVGCADRSIHENLKKWGVSRS